MKKYVKLFFALIGMICAVFIGVAFIGLLGHGGDDACTKSWIFLRDMPIPYILIISGLAIYFLSQLEKLEKKFIGD